MSERYLQWVYPGEVPDYERADPAEVLAEMPTEALVEELLRRRGVLIESRSGAYRLAYMVVKGAAENG